jgi:hypothetical protein
VEDTDSMMYGNYNSHDRVNYSQVDKLIDDALVEDPTRLDYLRDDSSRASSMDFHNVKESDTGSILSQEVVPSKARRRSSLK